MHEPGGNRALLERVFLSFSFLLFLLSSLFLLNPVFIQRMLHRLLCKCEHGWASLPMSFSYEKQSWDLFTFQK